MIIKDFSKSVAAENLGITPKGDDTDRQSAQPTIKDMDSDDRPRERAARYGISSLSTPDLLALILRTGTPGNPITRIMRDLMSAHDGKLHNLENSPINMLTKFKGIGEIKAQQLQAILELIKRYNLETASDNPIIKQSGDIYNLMRVFIGNLDHEEIWTLLLNRRNEVLERHRITSGTQSASIFDHKMILKRALLANAQGIVLCHNHPSGTLYPSPQDDNITRQLKEGCRLLGFNLLDHVIITAHGYYSYHDEGKV